MVKPVIPTKVILKRNAQLYFTAVMQELYYQVFVVEIKPSP